MRRRKYLAAVGSLAAGGAAMMGTGAFSTTTEPGLAVDVVGAASAYVGVYPNTDSEYVTTSGGVPSGSPFEIDLASDSGSGGSGLPEYSHTMIAPAFRLRNQSSESLYTEIYNPLANNDITTTSSNQNFTGRGGGRDRDLAIKGLDVQFLATGSLPITGSAALIDRDSPPVNTAGSGFDDITSNAYLFGSAEGVSNNRLNLQNFDAGAIKLDSGEELVVSTRVVVRDVDTDPPGLRFRVEAYDDTSELTYDVV